MYNDPLTAVPLCKKRLSGVTSLILLTKVRELYDRLNEKQKSTLLQILVKRIIVNIDGEIFAYELNSPFVYLRTLVDSFFPPVIGKSAVRNRFCLGHQTFW